MMEEVSQQPAALAAVRKYYTSPGAIPAQALKKMVEHWPPTVVFTGMGSSLFAAYPAQAYLTALGTRALVWETAELVHHHLKVLRPDTLLVVVSQSGETVEIVRLLDQLPKKTKVVAVVNVEESTLAGRSSLPLPMLAGGQASVSTKTYVCAVATLMYLAVAITRQPLRPLTETLVRAIELQETILEQRDVLTSSVADFFGNPPYVLLMSRGADLSSVYQGSLMFKEVVRLAAEPISAAQFRHGPIEIISPQHRYVIFARQGKGSRPGDKNKAAKFLIGLAEEIRTHGGKILLLSDMPFAARSNVRLVPVEPLGSGLGTLVDSLLIQLLTHELAQRAGREPGKFWIAEDVTRVE
jgi:glucosamine--fructose-6-phosphate aminotransferase (isomerizing)